MAPPPALQQAQQAQQQQQQQQQPQQQPPPPPQQQQQQQQPQPQQQALRKSEAASHWRSGMEGAEVARGAQPCPAPASTPARTAARAGVAPSGGAADPRGASLTSAEVLPPPAGLVRGLYPLRPGRPNCSYYLSTGDCAFKQRCVYNHPEQLPLSRADSAERWTSRAQPAAAAAAGGDAASAAAGGDAPAAAPATSGSPGTEASTAGAALFGASSLAADVPQPQQRQPPKPAPLQHQPQQQPPPQQQQQPQQQPPPQQQQPSQQQQQQQPQPQQQALRKSEAAAHWRSGMEGAEVARGAQPCPAPASTPARTAARAGVAPSGGAADPRGASLTGAEVLPPPAGLVRGLYPLRPGRPNCSYYLSTGDCAFKQRCVYNHPEQLPLSRADSAERWTSRAQPAAAAAAGGDAASAAAGGDAPAAAPATSGSPGTEASTAGAALFGASSLAGAGASGGGAAAAGAPQVPPAPNGPAPAAAQQAARPCVTFMLRGVCAQGAACPFEHPARDARRSPSAAVSAAAVWQPPASPQATSGLAQLPSAHAVVAQPAEPPAAPAAPPAAAGATPAAVRTSPPGFGAANSAQAQAPADTGTLQPQAGAAGALGGASASSSAAAAPAPAATQQPAAAAAAPAQAPAATSAVQQPAAAPAGDAPCTSSAARAHQAHPVACHNSDGLPMRLHGAINCPFYMHTGQCRYGRSCRFHHPEAPALPAAYVESGGTYMAPRWKGPVSYARLLNHLERLWDADFCPAAQLKLLLARHMLAAANPGCSMWSPSAAQHVSTEPHRYRIAVQQAGELLLRLWAAQPDADAAAQPMPYRGRGSGGAGLQALLADDPYFQTAADEGRSHHYWVLLQLPKIVQLLNW